MTTEFKTYKEWCSILENECGMKITDDDGGRALLAENRLDTPITKIEAENYFMICTLEGTAKSIEKAALNRFFNSQ